MTARDWWIAVVRLSDSFERTVGDLAAELGAGVVEWTPDGGPAPGEAAVMLLLSGGAEQAAADLLPDLPAERPRYVVGGVPDHRIAAAVFRQGARDYFALPDDLDLLRRTLEREGREWRGRAAAEGLAAAERREGGFAAILGRSVALRQVLEQAARVATHGDLTVLIGGETGTGKELLASAIHYQSSRAAAPFVAINCAAIPATLLESELFGHEKGAFTGAVTAKAGLFELADGGTLLLDEIGHLPLELQPKLLRALEARAIRRVGGSAERPINVRVIASTHLDLGQAVGRREFREDLYYRLNVVSLVLPPLRFRQDDVELLAEAFVARLAPAYGLPIPPLTPEFRAALRAHDWPGNIRELRNAVERALVLSAPGTLDPAELPPRRRKEPAPGAPLPFPTDLETLARAAARAMVEVTGGNKSEAARRLGVSRPRLLRLLSDAHE